MTRPAGAPLPPRRRPSVPKRAMRRVRPAAVEEIREPEGIRLLGFDQALAVVLVHRRLLGHQEPSPHPGGLRTEGEHGRDTPPVADPAGAITGVGSTASTTAGTSASVPT